MPTVAEEPEQLGLSVPSPSDGSPPLTTAQLPALIEALLLVAPEPPALAELARAAGVGVPEVERALQQLDARPDRGWNLQRHGDRVQLVTAPRFAAQVRAFLRLDREVRLSGAALETLAVIAYQQPATRAEIEAVRSVDCSGVVATLFARGLIDVVGRRQTVGTPHEYATTPEFLRHFGLGSLADLPPLDTVAGEDAHTALARAAALGESPTADAQAP